MKDVGMTNRAIRTLPFPLISIYTPEIVARIKAIPDEDIVYTENEIEWMNRALENLNYMLAYTRLDELSSGIKLLALRRAQIESALAGCKKQQGSNNNYGPAD